MKPEFNSNEGLSSVSPSAHLLAEALLCYADDEGFFNANPVLVRAGTCPLRKDFKNVSKLLDELAAVGYVRFGTAGEKHYGQIVGFKVHQKISHPTASKINKLKIVWENSPENSGVIPKKDGAIQESSSAAPEPAEKLPDTLRPEQGTGNREQGKEQGTGRGDSGSTPEPGSPPALRAAFSPDNDEAHMIATAVVDSIGVTTRWARDQIFEQAKHELKEHPGDLDQIRDGMIAAWKEYCLCAKGGKLRSPPTSPEKFFGEGKWKSSKLWGLKNGMRAYESAERGP